MSKLSLLTVVVPTYNRHPFAIRQMEYWKGYPVKLHVLDGSDSPISSKIIDGLPGNITYHHLPVSLQERFKKGVDLVETPYAILMGDDEFYIPSAITQCIDELEKDRDLISCMGLALRFWYGPGNKILGKDAYQRLKDYKVDQDGAVERMNHHMSTYICSTIYSVMRSSPWKKNMELYAAKHYSSPVPSEIQFELGTCYQGKSKVINSLFWLRSDENRPISNEVWNRKINYLMWDSESQYEDERTNFVIDFVRHYEADGMSKLTKSDVREALSALVKFVLEGEKPGFVKKYFRKTLSISIRLIQHLSLRLANALRRTASNLHYYVFSDKELKHYASEFGKLPGVSVDYQAVSKIIDIVNDFRAKT